MLLYKIINPPNSARFNPQQAGCSYVTFRSSCFGSSVDLALTSHCASDKWEDRVANTRVSTVVLSLPYRRRDQFSFE